MTCAHGMPTPTSCVDCMDEGLLPTPARPEPEQRDGRVISCNFGGHCGICNLPTEVSELIVHTTRNRWVHARCLP